MAIDLIGKRIDDLIKDKNYLIFKFDDGSLLPVINMNSDLGKNYILNNEKECIFCKRKIKILTLNNEDYICLDCTLTLLEKFAKLGETIKLNLSKISPELAKQLNKVIKGDTNIG